MRARKIVTFYNKKQVCFDNIRKSSYSKSPLKPYLLLKKIKDDGYSDMLNVVSDFKPFTKNDFYTAHTKHYVNNVFNKRGNYNSNSVPWSHNLVESLTYTNASLYNAIKYAVQNPDNVTFSPTSGFHHASPKEGSGFCTFSGQVIASTKIYREFGLSGCYFDLDGHFGNSIEDSRKYVHDLNKAIPVYANINPKGTNDDYVDYLKRQFKKIEEAIIKNKIHYVVWCHGADSHEDDDLGHQCSTYHWLKCADLFYSWIKELDKKLGRSIPVTLALFGGYRKDDYNSVLSLHMNDLIKCSNILCGNDFEEKIEVKNKPKTKTQAYLFEKSSFEYDVPEIQEEPVSDNFEDFEAEEFKKQNFNYTNYKSWKEWYRIEKDKKRMKLFGTL